MTYGYPSLCVAGCDWLGGIDSGRWHHGRVNTGPRRPGVPKNFSIKGWPPARTTSILRAIDDDDDETAEDEDESDCRDPPNPADPLPGQAHRDPYV
jgi:hypothetical protein